MKKIFKKANPGILIWLIVPVFALSTITHYFIGGNRNTAFSETDNDVSTKNGLLETSKFQNILNGFDWEGSGVVSFVFIGGNKNQYVEGYSLMESYKYPASMTIPISKIGQPSNVTWLNLRFLESNGWKIIPQMESDLCLNPEDVNSSKQTMEDLGFDKNLFLAPCRSVSETVLTNVKRGYNGLLTFNDANNNIKNHDNYSLRIRRISNLNSFTEIKGWIDETNLKANWMILGIPEIGNSNDTNHISRDYLMQILNEIEKSKIQVGITEEII